MSIQKDPMNAQGFRTQRSELPEDLWQPLIKYSGGIR
jgi:hypothetical protein